MQSISTLAQPRFSNPLSRPRTPLVGMGHPHPKAAQGPTPPPKNGTLHAMSSKNGFFNPGSNPRWTHPCLQALLPAHFSGGSAFTFRTKDAPHPAGSFSLRRTRAQGQSFSKDVKVLPPPGRNRELPQFPSMFDTPPNTLAKGTTSTVRWPRTYGGPRRDNRQTFWGASLQTWAGPDPPGGSEGIRFGEASHPGPPRGHKG